MNAMMSSTALVAVTVLVGSAVAQQQQTSGTAQYCIEGASGPAKCEFHTMAHCEKAKTGSSEQCVPRSKVEGTVGGQRLPHANGLLVRPHVNSLLLRVNRRTEPLVSEAEYNGGRTLIACARSPPVACSRREGENFEGESFHALALQQYHRLTG